MKTKHPSAHACHAKPRAASSFWHEEIFQQIVYNVCATYEDEQGINHIDDSNMPQRDEILDILAILLEILFPGYSGRHTFHRAALQDTMGALVRDSCRRLTEQIERAFAYRCMMDCCAGCDCRRLADEAVTALFQKLPIIRDTLKTDVQAAMDGDPAAKSIDEVVIAYPGLQAVSVHRIAHELYKAEIPLIPRVMAEFAHTTTGIDIHPGAEIGKSFFIDHGTGVVIGETAVIGENVKLYQGVTLGALSFPKDERGRLIKGMKRHPNIEDNVTIYAGATILGDITIGHDSVIGGNVWLTESVQPHTKIAMAAPELSVRRRQQSADT